MRCDFSEVVTVALLTCERQPGDCFGPGNAQEITGAYTDYRPQIGPATPLSISATSSPFIDIYDIDDNKIDHDSFFVPPALATTASPSRVPPPLAPKASFVDSPRDFALSSQRLPPTPPHDASDLVSLSPPTNAVSAQRTTFLPMRYSTPFLNDLSLSSPDLSLEDKYMAAAKRAITLESRLPSRRLSTRFQITRPPRSVSPVYTSEADVSFPYVSDTSTPYDGVWRLKNLLRGPRRIAPPNTPSASPVRRFLQRRAEQEWRSLSPSYEQDGDDSLISEAGRARPPGRCTRPTEPATSPYICIAYSCGIVLTRPI